MPRENNNHNNRGRGNGNNGRGGGRGYRGRGRGNFSRGGGGGPGRNNYPHSNTELDFVIQQWTEEPLDARGNMNRGGGPWKGGTQRSGTGAPMRGTDSARRANSTPRGRGRGRARGRGGGQFDSPRTHLGFGAQKGVHPTKVLGKDAPLSNLLYSERPFLRPVIFVPAKLTPFLFQESEELLKPVSEEVGATEESHAPTAERVARVFSGKHESSGNESTSESDASDELEEVDFADLGKIRAEVDAAAAVPKNQQPTDEMEEIDFADLARIRAEVDAAAASANLHAPPEVVPLEAFTGVYNAQETTRISASIDTPDVDQQDVTVQQTVATSVTSTDSTIQALGQSVEVLKVSSSDISDDAQGTLVVEEETPSPSSGSEDVVIAALPSFERPAALHAPQEVTSPTLSHLEPLLQGSRNSDASHINDSSTPLFVIDTKPTRPFGKRSASDVILVDRTGGGEMLGEDDELIVYIAPHPRSGRASPIPTIPRVNLPNTSMLTGISANSGARNPIREDNEEGGIGQAKPGPEPPSHSSLTLNFSSPAPTKQPRNRPLFTPSERSKTAFKARKKEARIQRRRQRKDQSTFASLGAMLSEARLREDDERERRQPKWETRRRGDSDLDWGTDEENDGVGADGTGMSGLGDDDEVDKVSNGLGGMDLDPDVGDDINVMKGFLKSMSAEGSRFVTIDDIQDGQRIREEDEEDGGGAMGSSGSGSSDDEDEGEEEELVFEVEEAILIAESEDEGKRMLDDSDGEASSDNSSEDDENRSPGTSFQARLRKVRERDRGKMSKAEQEISDDDESETPRTRRWDDNEFFAQIEDILEENSDILTGRDRKLRKKFFRHLNQGNVDGYDLDDLMDISDFSLPVNKGKKGKGKAVYFADELQAQWQKDRAKKAEYKRKRAEARLLSVLDPLSTKKGGKKGRKAMLTASRLDPDNLASMPNAVVDMESLEKQIRRFVENIDGKPTMALPPMDKASRKSIHEIAAAFGLKSQSKGKGPGRYTTLIKTTRTRVASEGKLRPIMKRFGRNFDRAYDRKQEKGGHIPKHRDGDEVGKEAPKIGESNIGFKMLASMGWSEGDKIGGNTSVGIETPLTAIIKNTKLGLGAR
ncbi:hypothetical protein HYDPIDRAFT_117800 [Hydnomerulius pinastri MD-312]|uniref:Protein SQS1 n=1 Tax=Hydnomerulius pinastri MD-312 TaxID=994086 RepID=A0A0C9W291_9AGAM|nr:hypothetical protein HYDPIDRAFT_117800 [Hydnomerulius pinastri MD-312]